MKCKNLLNMQWQVDDVNAYVDLYNGLKIIFFLLHDWKEKWHN